MNAPSLWPLLWRITYLTAILGGGFYFYAQIYAANGSLVLTPERPERLVASPQGGGGLGNALRLGVPPELLRAQQPRAYERALDKDTLYHEQDLPFSVTLTKVEVLEARDAKLVLQLRRGKDTQDLPATPGAHIAWDTTTEATLREVRPWIGLLRTPSGSPTATLSLRKADEAWTRGVFLHDGQWQPVAPDAGLLLRWCKSEDDARARLPEQLDPLFGARWGAIDGAQVNWFAGFASGTGATLSDDTEITLLEVAADHAGQGPALRVARKPKNAPASEAWYHADDATAPIRLELGTRFARHVLLNAWRDGAALIAVYDHGTRGELHLLNEGEILDAAQGPGFAIRLDGVLRTATPSTASDTVIPPSEAVLDTPQGEVVIREGLMHGLPDGAQLRFRKVSVAPRVRYTLSLASSKEDRRERTLTLGESLRQGDWRLSYDQEVIDPTKIMVLRAERSLWTPRNLAGPTLLALGCYGFVIARALLLRRAAYSSSESSLTTGGLSSEAEEIDKVDN